MSRTAIWISMTIAMMLPVSRVFAQGGEQESEITGVSTRVAFLRLDDAVLHVGVVFHNTTDSPVQSSSALAFGALSIVDAKSGSKSFALRDAAGHFLAGPISDWNNGGRWFPDIAAGSEVLVWAMFEPVGSDHVDLSVPLSQPFDAVPVTMGPPPTAKDVGAAQGHIRAALVSATRADGQLKVRIKLTNPGVADASGPAVKYADAYVLDPASHKKYGLVKDADGNFLAQPISDGNDGGRLFLSEVPPGGQKFLALTFTAPPDAVRSVDIVVPWIDPIEHVEVAGAGGAADAGTAAAGRTIGLQRALQDLHADVTPAKVTIDLSGDVLFDFGKTDLKPAALTELGELATVVEAYPGSTIDVDGYTDSKGGDVYNLTLSKQRAASVATWLTTTGGIPAARVRTHGHGSANPIAPNTNADGSDNPDGRAKNRRVEVTIAR